MTSQRAVFRFAPSPNGDLHLGHALSALIGHDWACAVDGRFLVRIEDVDVGRCNAAFADAILEDLRWLGIRWDDPVVRQSEEFAAYRTASGRLEQMGLLYPCFATRAQIAAASLPDRIDPDGAPLYPGLHRGMNAHEAEARKARGEPFALRLDMARALAQARVVTGGEPLCFTEVTRAGDPRMHPAEAERWGDAVIVRKDVPASYHLAVVVDDARQGITHVTRGQDLFAATGLHRLLQVLLALPEPVYHHHRLVTDAAGRKLSKSARDTSLRSLRRDGLTPDGIRQLAGLG